MRWTRQWWMALAAAASLGLALGGCGDSNVFDGVADSSGYEAQKEEGLQALKDGDWDKAVQVFGELDRSGSSPETRKYLASAYAGRAGFDGLTLLEAIGDAEDANDGAYDESVTYDAVTRMFAGPDGTLTPAELESKVADLLQALTVLGQAQQAQRANSVDASGMTLDEVVQAGLYAAAEAVLGIASQLVGEDGNLLVTLDALRASPEVIDAVVAPAQLNVAFDWVERAKEALLDGGQPQGDPLAPLDEEKQNDIADEFDEFLREVGYYAPSPEDRDATTAEVRSYLKQLLGLGEEAP